MNSAATLLDLLGGELNRRILELTDEQPRSAEEVADGCDASLPTVYRHVDDLTSAGLLAERTEYDAEGNHYKTYTAVLTTAAVRLGDGELTVDVMTDDGADEGPQAPTPEDVQSAGSEPVEEIDRPTSEE